MRLPVAIAAFIAAIVASPVAEACSCICPASKQPQNGIERREQVRQTVLNFDYVFVGEIVAIGEAEPLPADTPRFAEPFHPITIRPAKILKGPQSDLITVMARLGDGANCFNELSIGGHFRGLAMREGDTWRATNWNYDCDNWAIFYDDGPLADAKYRKSLPAGCPR